jgi:glycosyltransferase involved in cell wall biosynthesis
MGSESPLRVCIPIGRYPPLFTGQGIQIQRSLPYLRARGIEPTILTCRLPRSFGTPPPDDVGTVDRILAPGLNHLSVVRRIAQMRHYFTRRRGAFDVLHCDLLGWEFLLNVRYVKSLGLPVILEMALLGGDDPLSTSKEHFGSFKLKLLRGIDIWMGLSGAFMPRVLAAGIPEDRFRLVYPGVEVDLYRPFKPDEHRAARLRLGLPAEARVVVSVGSVMRRKGTDRVLRAWERLRPQRGRDVLVFVGPACASDGLPARDLSFARALQEASCSPGLEGTVRWVGRVENVHDYLGVADLFLFLSRQEGLGIVILEAQSCGLPCVVSPLDGIAAEIVSEGRTGHIVEDPDDADAVAACVSRLLDQPQVRAAMGEVARRTIEERFSFGARADTLASIYRGLASQSRRPPAR